MSVKAINFIGIANMNSLLILLLVGQVPLPPELDKTPRYLSDLPPGQTVRVYKDAVVVDLDGRCWIRGDWITETAPNKFTRYKELEVTRTNTGYSVRVLPLWSSRDNIYLYPQWERAYRRNVSDMPVDSFVIVPKPKPRASYFAELDSYYRSKAFRYAPPPVPRYMREY